MNDAIDYESPEKNKPIFIAMDFIDHQTWVRNPTEPF